MRGQDSNLRPQAYEAYELTGLLYPASKLAEAKGFEPHIILGRSMTFLKLPYPNKGSLGIGVAYGNQSSLYTCESHLVEPHKLRCLQ